MKKTLLIIAGAILMMACGNRNANAGAAAAAEEAQIDSTSVVQVGDKAPAFVVEKLDGTTFNLADHAGDVVWVNFWATWCYYCKMEMPDFNEAYKNNPDIQFLMVNVTDGYQETMDTAKKYLAEEGFEFPVLYDTSLEAANTYGASGLPMTVFIDEEGNMVTIARGMLSAEDLAKGLDFLK